MMMEKPTFHQLRTVEQLGYIVWSGTDVREGVNGMRVIVQSAKKDADCLDRRVDAFLRKFRAVLQGMKWKKFRTFVRTLVGIKMQLPRTLVEETARYWYEISTQQYLFDRRFKELIALRYQTRSKFLRFVDRLFGFSGVPSKISVGIQAQDTTSQTEGCDPPEEEYGGSVEQPQQDESEYGGSVDQDSDGGLMGPGDGSMNPQIHVPMLHSKANAKAANNKASKPSLSFLGNTNAKYPSHHAADVVLAKHSSKKSAKHPLRGGGVIKVAEMSARNGKYTKRFPDLSANKQAKAEKKSEAKAAKGAKEQKKGFTGFLEVSSLSEAQLGVEVVKCHGDATYDDPRCQCHTEAALNDDCKEWHVAELTDPAVPFALRNHAPSLSSSVPNPYTGEYVKEAGRKDQARCSCRRGCRASSHERIDQCNSTTTTTATGCWSSSPSY